MISSLHLLEPISLAGNFLSRLEFEFIKRGEFAKIGLQREINGTENAPTLAPHSAPSAAPVIEELQREASRGGERGLGVSPGAARVLSPYNRAEFPENSARVGPESAAFGPSPRAHLLLSTVRFGLLWLRPPRASLWPLG